MRRQETRKTADGSLTLFDTGTGDTYHSIHGARTESSHIFIGLGLNSLESQKINILEMGFGTGLNALLTAEAVKNRGVTVNYHGVDAFPLADEVLAELERGADNPSLFREMHAMDWGAWGVLMPGFRLLKERADLRSFDPGGLNYDLVYFDAFSPDLQPELWTAEVFKGIGDCCSPGAILVTYSSKGAVRRALGMAGWKVEKHPGPPGKREIIKAINHG